MAMNENKKEPTQAKGFHLDPLDFDALNIYAAYTKQAKSKIIRNLLQKRSRKPTVSIVG